MELYVWGKSSGTLWNFGSDGTEQLWFERKVIQTDRRTDRPTDLIAKPSLARPVRQRESDL